MKTILLVDDEYALVENLTELLQDEGYRVVSAANGKDGLVRALAESPDLIVTDFMMPIADGRELIVSLRAEAAARVPPIIMMSATVRAIALSDGDGGQLSVAAFLSKPIAWDKLLGVVVKLIGRGNPLPR